MNASLEWDRNQRATVSSVQELDCLLDQLTREAAHSYPFSVDLILDSGDALSMVIGESITPVQFYSLTGHPLVVGCSGPWEGEEGDQLFVFDHRGSYSEIEKRYTIPIADAREATRRFLATGERPHNVTWNA